MIRPVTASLLQQHLDSFELRLSPGLTTLTWASLNIGNFLQSASNDLEKLNLLVVTVNDIVENRIESNIKVWVHCCQMASACAGYARTIA